jgi:hypothetical protein
MTIFSEDFECSTGSFSLPAGYREIFKGFSNLAVIFLEMQNQKVVCAVLTFKLLCFCHFANLVKGLKKAFNLQEWKNVKHATDLGHEIQMMWKHVVIATVPAV